MIARSLGNILWFMLIAVATGIGGLAGKDIAKNYLLSSHEEDVLAALRKKSAEMNSGFPQMLDSETRADTTTVGSDPLSLTYSYTLVNHDSADIHWPSFRDVMWDKTKAHYCDAMKPFIKEDVRVIYSYQGKDEVPIGTIHLSPPDCMKPEER